MIGPLSPGGRWIMADTDVYVPVLARIVALIDGGRGGLTGDPLALVALEDQLLARPDGSAAFRVLAEALAVLRVAAEARAAGDTERALCLLGDGRDLLSRFAAVADDGAG
jgi:hypothetical protein